MWGQDASKIAEIKAKIAIAPYDTNLTRLYGQLGMQYEYVDNDSAAYFYRQIAYISRRLHYPRGLVYYAANYTFILNYSGRMAEALHLNKAALALAKKHNMPREMALAEGNIAASYQYMDRPKDAIAHLLASIAYWEQHEAKEALNLSTLYHNLSQLYNSILLYPDALKYSKMAFDIGVKYKIEDAAIGNAASSTGTSYSLVGNHKSALQYLNIAKRYAEKSGNKELMVNTLLNLANELFYSDKYADAGALYRQEIPIARAIGDSVAITLGYKGLAINHFYERKNALASLYVDSAIMLAARGNQNIELAKLYLLRSDISVAMGSIKEYRSYRDQYDLVHDSLRKAESNQFVQEAMTKFDTQKKEIKIRELAQQQKIKDLKIKQKNYGLLALGLGVLVLAVAIFLYYRNTQNRQLIASQNQTLQSNRIKELEQERALLTVNSVLRGQEEERSRLAKDLHDGLGGMLSAIKMGLVNMKGNMIMRGDDATAFSNAIGQLDNSIQEMRRVARNMMPETLVRFGLRDALQDYCDSINAAGQLKVIYQTLNFDARIEANAEIVVYRVLQELLNNVIKHAGATQVLVQVAIEGPILTFTVEDDGHGFDTKKLDKEKGIGMSNIQSRMDYLGGTLDIQSGPEGTSVHGEIPLG